MYPCEPWKVNPERISIKSGDFSPSDSIENESRRNNNLNVNPPNLKVLLSTMTKPTVADSHTEEVDDYMSMTITEASKPLEKETYTQRRIRKQRESEARSRTKSKAEIAADTAAARDNALHTALPNSSKGFQMMAKLGFKPGNALGASTNVNARTEPLSLAVKEDRGGVGLENEKKRKFREEAAATAQGEKRIMVEEGDYRERVGREREEKRLDGLCWGAMRVLEGLEQPEGSEKVPVKKINVLYRGLVRERKLQEDERRMRYDLHQSLTRDPKYEDPGEDEHDKQALGTEEEELEEEDEELDGFLSLEAKERLKKIIEYLRAEHLYCFWCKCSYDDRTMDGCPGIEEDDHD